jgi:hypothetical protein
MKKTDYKSLWLLTCIEDPNWVSFYRFLIFQHWDDKQEMMLIKTIIYYESILSMPDKIEHIFNKLDKNIQKKCTKTKQDICHHHLLDCIEIINGGQTFFPFGEMEYRSIEKVKIIPNAIKILIDDYLTNHS